MAGRKKASPLEDVLDLLQCSPGGPAWCSLRWATFPCILWLPPFKHPTFALRLALVRRVQATAKLYDLPGGLSRG